MKNMKKKISLTVLVILFLTVVIGITTSYAVWRLSVKQTEDNEIATDCFQMTFAEQDLVSLENSFPIYDEEGKQTKPYIITVTNHCERPVSYEITLETTTNTTLKNEYLKIMVGEENPRLLSSFDAGIITISNGKEAFLLGNGVIDGNNSKELTFRLWIDEDVTIASEGIMNSKFEGRITIKGSYLENYQEELLNGTDPVLADGLIPVTIEPNGTVKKADIRNKWYSYKEKQWANAVILEDESITYQNGEVIPESNIESYFVWIPRYKYQIFNEGTYNGLTSVENKVQTIQVVFENKDTLVSNGSTVGSWLTHPAFTAFNSNGMWVGKFETGKKSGSDNVRNGEQVQIKPNVSSWRNIQVANAFYTTYDYKRELDSHMMKNTEWGAVAYLQHSAYGSQQSVRINNNSSYITGYSANQEPTCGYTGTNEECNINCNDGSCNQPYNTAIGYLASTTGNISGIYDMAGGSWEYVMGVMLDSNNKLTSGRNSKQNSGFNGTLSCPACEDTSGITTITDGYDFPNSKYYDTYEYGTTEKDYSHRLAGDATGEMGPFGMATYESQTRNISSWYEDQAYFVFASFPWFVRGTHFYYGTNSGIFAFGFNSGSLNDIYSFRVVLTP